MWLTAKFALCYKKKGNVAKETSLLLYPACYRSGGMGPDAAVLITSFSFFWHRPWLQIFRYHCLKPSFPTFQSSSWLLRAVSLCFSQSFFPLSSAPAGDVEGLIMMR